ncbi:MAG: protein translocase subunit SecF [Treponema sp.]|nr:protein translocase subunit SecF [Treponema sp.]
MKKNINFNKGFLPACILSCAIIVFGIVGFITKGINLGLDFRPGLIEEIRVASPVADISYTGPAKVSLNLSAGQMDIVISGTGADNETRSFNFAVYKTVEEVAAEVNKIENVQMNVLNGAYDSTKLFLNSAVTNQLSSTPIYVYPAGTSEITTDDIRAALGEVGGNIKQLGTGEDASYQIRMGVSEGDAHNAIQSSINDKLFAAFGKEKVAIVKTDYIGAGSSKTTSMKSIIMFVAVIALIWLYATIRFHWDFALGSVIALLHDTLIMFTFIVWTQMEFSSTVLAAVLTIVGYSINATVVILDRVRYNLKMMSEAKTFNEILNKSLSDTFTRSVLTTVTTLFAVVSLFVFTTGSIKDFSLAMIVGLICGMYSSILISSGFISASRKNWKPEFGIHHSLKHVRADEE